MKQVSIVCLMFVALGLNAQSYISQNGIQYQFICPYPNSEFHNINTGIVIRHGVDLDISSQLSNSESIVITGNLSGNHEFTLWLSSDGKTMQIDPIEDFALLENVSVTISGLQQLNTGQEFPALEFSFTTSSKLPDAYRAHEIYEQWLIENPQEEEEDGERDYPVITNLVMNDPSPGNIFMNTTGLEKFIAVLDSAASAIPLWFIPSGLNGNDFKVNLHEKITMFNRLDFNWLEMDEYTDIIDTLKMVNGYLCDDHECMVTPDGHYFLQCYDDQVYDMSEWVTGGNPQCLVKGYVFQEFDENDDLILQWRTWEYFEPTDNTYLNLTQSSLDLWHGNAIEIDSDQHVLFSFRNIDEITKIDRNSGDIIWRLGNGIQNEFAFTNDPAFTYQHDVRRLANGNITIYDNGNFNLPQVSRCVEYSVNEVNHTVTKVWEYVHPEGLFAPSMGGCQRLENGNTLINWGNVLNDDWGARVTEVDPAGNIMLEYAFPIGYNTYRTHKKAWFFDDSLFGCTDPSAINFNPDAEILNDDYCQYDNDGDGFSAEMGDCNDEDEFSYPDAEEIPYNGIDEDCSNGDLVDVDEDGFDYLNDCDDNNGTINPDGVEIPNNGIDEDCADGDLILPLDEDGDGFTTEFDCNDNDDEINPDATEIPYNGIDDDCEDGDLIDVDGDGFDYTTDCDDTNDEINPDAFEIPYNGVDDDCTDGDLTDVDGDGVNGPEEDCNDNDEAIFPGATEIPNDGIDQDCANGDLIIGVGESVDKKILYFFPNPVYDKLDIYSPYSEGIDCEIYDSEGKLVMDLQLLPGDNLLNCSGWSAGQYLVKLMIEGKVENYNFMVR